jgi:hypothetical protein
MLTRSPADPIWVGPSTEIKQADDPCRVIEIVALTGQLYATNNKDALM